MTECVESLLVKGPTWGELAWFMVKIVCTLMIYQSPSTWERADPGAGKKE
jgi:hypothetical protein